MRKWRAIVLLTYASTLVCSASGAALDGLWQTYGYNYIFVIKGPSLTSFEITTTTTWTGIAQSLSTAKK